MSFIERFEDFLLGLCARYGERRVIALSLLGIAGFASVTIQILIRTDYDHSGLLYLAVPYVVAVLITLLRPYENGQHWWQQYLSHALSALVVFLGSSVLLFEGFICVLFFMPIYFVGVTLAFLAHWMTIAWGNRRGKTYATAIPLLVAVLSLEGTTEQTTFDRSNVATAEVLTHLSSEELLSNLAQPFVLPPSNDWMLGIFPMPYDIQAGTLNVGDVHRAQLRYKRWFVTNVHNGEIAIRIDSVESDRVTASFVKDTSYFSNYLTLTGSDIRFAATEQGTTKVTLSIAYERELDPAWYFQPIQQYAVAAMAEHLVEQLLIRE